MDEDFFSNLSSPSSAAQPQEDDNPTVVLGAATGGVAESADEQFTDEVIPLDAPDRVPLTSHAAGGSVGTWARPDDEQDAAPGYARGSGAQPVEDDETTEDGSAVEPQPFWALAPTERDVLDDLGRPLFRIGPLAWALVLEDRGGAYVIRHDDGRIGYLHDISDLRKG